MGKEEMEEKSEKRNVVESGRILLRQPPSDENNFGSHWRVKIGWKETKGRREILKPNPNQLLVLIKVNLPWH